MWIRYQFNSAHFLIHSFSPVHVFHRTLAWLENDLNSPWAADCKRPFHALSEAPIHYSDVVMTAMASQSTGVSIVCSTVCSGIDQRKRQSSSSLAFVGVGRGEEQPTKVTEKCSVSDTFHADMLHTLHIRSIFCEITNFIRFWRQSWIYLSMNRYLWVYNHTHFTFNLNNISKQNFIIPWPE